MKKDSIATVDDYIAGFPSPVKKILSAMRKTIKSAAPKAEELNQLPDAGLQITKEYWYILPLLKNILGFMPHLPVIVHLRKNCRNIKQEKALCNFH